MAWAPENISAARVRHAAGGTPSSADDAGRWVLYACRMLIPSAPGEQLATTAHADPGRVLPHALLKGLYSVKRHRHAAANSAHDTRCFDGRLAQRRWRRSGGFEVAVDLGEDVLTSAHSGNLTDADANCNVCVPSSGH